MAPAGSTDSMTALLNIMRTNLHNEYADKGRMPSEGEVLAAARDLRNALGKLPMYQVTDEEFDAICRELLELVQHTMDYAPTLEGSDEQHQRGWYMAGPGSGRRFFWDRYRDYLKQYGLRSPDELAKLDRVTDEVMDQLGDPHADGNFQRRGLLMGDVQSGKTATFNALCCKAVDAGYEVIIVLSGISEILRGQTQSRLDHDLVGEDSQAFLGSGRASGSSRFKKVGVGLMPCDIPDEERGHITPFTSEGSDFSAGVLDTNRLNLENLRGAALFVVKKNAQILNNLRKWLFGDPPRVPEDRWALLLIDDEADNASVNTSAENRDPTAINREINTLLRSFRRASYVGITATPFANIFIDPATNEDRSAADLFPRHFLTLLSPPSHYIGPASLFGSGDVDEDGNESSDAKYGGQVIELANEELKECFPLGHKATLAETLTELPPSLCEALRYFIMASAVRSLRGDSRRHCSMLVNVSRYTAVQNRVAELVWDHVVRLRDAIVNYHGLPPEQALGISEIARFRDTWDEYRLEHLAGVAWPEFLVSHLCPAVKRIVVRAVNQQHSGALNYREYEDNGMRVVAVGGNALSRGFTLEGLLVSYFYRRTNMYDTLLQMGRWFGYRPGYEDLFRIWMGEDAVGWYGEITQAVEELKDSFRTMARQGGTPENFGIRIRHSRGFLQVTARNKMRRAQRITVPITVSGRMIETARLWRDPEKIRANNELCEKFIADLSGCGARHHFDEHVGAYIWHGVPAQAVAGLVDGYQCHPWHLDFQSRALAGLIANDGEWGMWDVGIPGGKGGEYPLPLPGCGPLTLHPEKRRLHADGSIPEMLRVNDRHVRIGSRGCTRIGLDWDTITCLSRQAAERGEKIGDMTYITAERRPLLLLHLLSNSRHDGSSGEFACFPRLIWALGLVFPGGRQEKCADYVVNEIWMKRYDALDDDYEEDDA